MRLLPLLVPVLLLAACAGPAVRDVPPPAQPTTPAPATPAAPLGSPAYETFDPGPYRAEPPRPPARTEVVHDAPAALLAGTIEEVEEPASTEPRTVQGFRIQLFASDSKPAADAVRDQALTWWRGIREELHAQEAFPHGMPSAVVFARPSYRVRVGAFESRAQGEAALEMLRERFPEAFLVPDTVHLGGD